MTILTPNELDKLALKQWHIQHQQTVLQALLRENSTLTTMQHIAMNSKHLAVQTMDALVRAGAADPLEVIRKDSNRQFREMGLGESERISTPLALLSSPKAKAFVVAIRAAADACREMEEERHGWRVDGIAEVLANCAAGAEFECYGPKGIGNRE